MFCALASHQCGPGSIPGLGVTCGLSLLLVLVLVQQPNVTSCLRPLMNSIMALIVFFSGVKIELDKPRVYFGPLKGAIHLNAIFLPLDMALMAISHSRFKRSKNLIIIP